MKILGNPSIAVVYLARSTDGSAKDFLPFARSYAQFGAGLDHDLVVILKGGADRPGTALAIQSLFDRDVTLMRRSDEGFDIHAYLDAAKLLKHDYICFLNTFSVLEGDDWLLKLVTPLLRDAGCGMTGATASYESLYDSYGLLTTSIWLANEGIIDFSPALAAFLHDEMSLHAPKWMAGAARGNPEPATPAELFLSPTALEQARRQWLAVTRSTGTLAEFNLFKPFPNPHLRSNAWVIARETLLSMRFRLDPSVKIHCCHFESGSSGLPTVLAERGLRQTLVGRDGREFAVEAWPESHGFRLGRQDNVLVKDNQVLVFDTATPERRRFLQICSWGQYIARTPEVFRWLGFDFAQGRLAHTELRRTVPAAAAGPVTVSIVIPTRNRNELVRQALHTVLNQAYGHWECCIFDNGSDIPVAETLSDIRDERVRVVRSESFLPVTDSWNRAIDLATGDYVTLIGDDDGFAPIYLNAITFMIDRHCRPDFIYSGFYQFFHPGVAPWEPSGYVADVRSGFFFRHEKDFFRLDEARATQAVRGSLQFRRNFTFNMQAFCFEKTFLDAVRHDGRVFHSPFPDYYLANVAFGLGKRITVAPKPISVAGVSRKSFGFTLFNNDEKRGAALLATEFAHDPLYGTIADAMLPGKSYVDNYLLTMAHVHRRLGAAAPCEVDVARYRKLQILSTIMPDPSLSALQPLDAATAARLTAEERAWVAALGADLDAAGTDPSARARVTATFGATQMYDDSTRSQTLDIGSFVDLYGLFEAIGRGDIREADI